MLVQTHTTFAIRCAQCGKMEPTTLSRFAVSSGESVKLTCACGSTKVTVASRHGQVSLQVPCYLCDGVHFFYFPAARFWRTQLETIPCTETDLQLGVFGGDKEVDLYVRTGGSELERLLDDEAFSDYFDEPDVMYQVLSRVHVMADEGSLTCSCGNREIAVDIYPEHLELTCPDCGRRKTLPAGTAGDLAVLEHVQHIQLGDDAPSRRKGHKK